jgi:hypothetical protein
VGAASSVNLYFDLHLRQGGLVFIAFPASDKRANSVELGGGLLRGIMLRVSLTPMGIGTLIRSGFSTRKLAGYAISALGLLWEIGDWGGRLDFFVRVAESMGATPAMIATAITSPWTGIVLIVTGITYVVFVGEPEKGVQRHPWWPYVGWTIFAVSLISLVYIVGRGALEICVRQEAEKIALGIPRGTPDENRPNRQQLPLTVPGNDLQPEQQKS